MTNLKTETKFQNLILNLQKLHEVIIAFSGGVDSAFLLKVAHYTLSENVIAVIVKSNTMFSAELQFAEHFAKQYHIKTYIKTIDLWNQKAIQWNHLERCYICKFSIFSTISSVAKANGSIPILDGTNYDDRCEYRPGRKAMSEFQIKSPLLDAKLTKREIRALSKKMNIPIYDKESNTCLLTRFPYNQKLEKEKLQKIEQLENYIRHKRNFQRLRIRYVGKNIINLETKKEAKEFLNQKPILSDIKQYALQLNFTLKKISYI